MRQHAILAVFIVLASWARPADSAQIFEELSLDAILRMDPSARSRSMGSAFGAVFWGEPDGWANPAVLGLARGMRYDDEASDFFGFRHDARRTTLGWGGVGVQLAGRPLDGMGGLRLRAEFTIVSGGETSVFRIEEEVKSWGVGLSIAELARTYARARGEEPPAFARFVDLAAGFTHNRYRSALFEAESEAIDWGLLARSGATFEAGGTDVQFSAGYAYAVHNANEAALTGSFGTIGRAWRRPRHGTSIHLGLDPPVFSSRRAWLNLQPLLSLGGAWDRVFMTADARRVDDATHLGCEIGLANVAFVRFGRPGGETRASGYGFALPIGRLVRARYDRARLTTDGTEFTNVDGWSVWLDPFAIAGALRGD